MFFCGCREEHEVIDVQILTKEQEQAKNAIQSSLTEMNLAMQGYNRDVARDKNDDDLRETFESYLTAWKKIDSSNCPEEFRTVFEEFRSNNIEMLELVTMQAPPERTATKEAFHSSVSEIQEKIDSSYQHLKEVVRQYEYLDEPYQNIFD